MKKKVLIIGAGPAGLTAAYEILKKNQDIDVTILEESSVIGGISQTHKYNGNRMDLGGHRFFSKDERVTNLWKEIMPLQGKPSKDDIETSTSKQLEPDGLDPEKVDNVMLIRHRVSRIFFLRKFFDYPITLKGETFKNMGFKNTLRAGFGYLGSCFHKRKEKSLEDFYINRFGKPLYQMFFEDYTTKLWGVHPSKISPDWGAQRVKGLSLWKAVWSFISKPFKKKSKKVETSLIEQFWYPKFGPGELYEEMARIVKEKGAHLIMDAEVNKIVRNNNHIEYIEALIDGKQTRFDADEFISSMPIKDLYYAFGKESSDEEVYNIATNLIYRDFITVGLLVDKLKIQNKTKIKTVGNIVPDDWIYIQERDVKVGRLQIFNNWSPYMVKDYKNYVFMGLEYFVTEGDEMWNMSDEDFIKFAISEMVKIDILDQNAVKDACRLKVKKAYPAYFGVYKDFDKVKNDLISIDNLYCVGRNGQHHYNNMDHSMVTAMEAASIVLGESTYSRKDIWEVNTEKEYHETKEENK
jgi:protoporphyrinogen oxidase